MEGGGKGEGGRQGCKYLNFKLDLGEEGSGRGRSVRRMR